MKLFFLNFLVVFFSLRISGFALQDNFPLITELELQEDSPYGYFSTFEATFYVSDNSRNLVDITLDITIQVRSGVLRTFQLSIFKTDFGAYVDESLTAYQNKRILDFEESYQPSGVRLVSGASTLRTRVALSEAVRAGESTTVSFNFLVENLICSSSGRIGIPSTWLSSLTDIAVTNLEYALDVNNDVDDVIVDFIPRTEDFEIDRNLTDGVVALNIVYKTSEVAFGKVEDPPFSFFSWRKPRFENYVHECPDDETDYTYFYILFSVPVIACLCLFAVSTIQRQIDQRRGRYGRNRRGNRNNTTLGGLRYFSANRDIILLPEGEMNRTTVRAVNEHDDMARAGGEFQQVVPVNTYRVELDNRNLDVESVASDETAPMETPRRS
eukprot:maker-scaffold_5-snap-gene-0.4-mRNA-1 protein AED:0.05 eAED:0.37 QI:0/0/0.33/1/1/1/3/417/382